MKVNINHAIKGAIFAGAIWIAYTAYWFATNR